MLSFFKKSGNSKPTLEKQKRDPARYKQEREIADHGSKKQRKALAKSPKTHLEILYYLAEKDPDPSVRRAVAANKKTPLHASEVIAKDVDVDVRLTLLKRLCVLLPDLTADEYSQLYAFAAQALGILALDEVLKVRLALSSALKDKAYAPPKVVIQLARDLERQVSEPILKYCSVLPDKELLAILSEHPKDWVIEAVAGREKVSKKVSHAIIKTKSTSGGQKLLENAGAEISLETIQLIVEAAKSLPEWHKPLALRRDLPPEMIKTIAMFVSKAVRNILVENADLDKATKRDVLRTAERRINFFLDKKGKPIEPLDKLKKMIMDDSLDEEAIIDALALRETGFVTGGLVHLSGLDSATVDNILNSRVPKAVVSLAWKAGMSMRSALKLQTDMLKIKPRELLYPKSGDDWPLKPKDMEWQISFFSEDAA